MFHRQSSSVVLEMFPEFGPGLTKVVTDKNFVPPCDRTVGDAIAVAQPPSKCAGLEIAIGEVAVLTQNDQGFRGRITIPALPIGVHAADGGGQTITGAVKVDSSGFSLITGKDAEGRALLG